MADPRSMQDYTGPERRKNLPTLELWQENIRALNQSELSNCQMRYALTGDELTFIMRFENQVPTGRLNFLFPELDRKRMASDGWIKFILTLSFSDDGRLSVEMRGRYERDSVPLDIKVNFVRDIGLGVGIAQDEVSYSDARDGYSENSSISEIIEATMKSGERKYARKDDDVRQISVEGMIAVLTRYMKDSAVRRRIT